MRALLAVPVARARARGPPSSLVCEREKKTVLSAYVDPSKNARRIRTNEQTTNERNNNHSR